jgi:hypothetical protein
MTRRTSRKRTILHRKRQSVARTNPTYSRQLAALAAETGSSAPDDPGAVSACAPPGVHAPKPAPGVEAGAGSFCAGRFSAGSRVASRCRTAIRWVRRQTRRRVSPTRLFVFSDSAQSCASMLFVSKDFVESAHRHEGAAGFGRFPGFPGQHLSQIEPGRHRLPKLLSFHADCACGVAARKCIQPFA